MGAWDYPGVEVGREDSPLAQDVLPRNPVTCGAGPLAAAPPLKGALGAVAAWARGRSVSVCRCLVSALCPRPWAV